MANTEGLTDEALQCLLGDPIAGSSALQRRMEMPMGDKPAARVTRPSKRPHRPVQIKHPKPETVENHTDTPLVIGNIVERRRTDRATSANKSTRKPSRFAMQSKGFPLLNAPFGSLVKKKTQTKSAITNGEETSETDRMISQMSPEEIRESVQELHQALSPETIQFLKSRSKKQAENNIENNMEQQITENKTPSPVEDDKERVANLLASVRNYEDMDALFQQEMGSQGVEEKNEFQLACELLRSSVPRQNLWAVRYLETNLREAPKYCLGTDAATDWPYPTVLPVSLRCLLDMSPSTVVGSQIQAHALRALFYLTSMRVPVDYVAYDVSTGDLQATATRLYQDYFLDDAVPSSTYLYSSTNSMQPLSVSQSTVAYATSSSTTSAKDDGEAFLQDPLWTLLSRMRIIPWISNWLKSDFLPADSVRAAIGLLIFLLQRSPGAATAVVQHSSLLTDLAKQDVGSTILLQCVAARQSRSTASLLAMSDQTIQNLISLEESVTSGSNDKHHKWTIVLWRTLLRYGMALDALPSVLNLAARHITLGSDLSCYFFSSFSTILNCIVAANKSPKEFTVEERRDETIISAGDRALLANAASWLSASRQQALRHVENLEESWLSISSLDDTSFLEKIKFYSSVFRFLASWTRMCESLASDPRDGDFKAEEFTESEEGLCINAVLSCLKYDSLKEIMGKALAGLTKDDFSPVDSMFSDISSEAASCSFAKSLLELLSTLSSTGLHMTKSASSLQTIHELIVDILHQKNIKKTSPQQPELPYDHIERSRRFWLNRVHSAYLKFLSLRGWDLDKTQRAVGTISLMKTIGHLNVGEESTAAILFSCDQLLSPSTQRDPTGPSIISTWFVRSLCVPPAGRAQLDHSFKLRGGSGISADRLGPFELQSLLSIAPSVTSTADNLLPLGQNWLWKSLAGAIQDSSGEGEALAVLLSTLELSCELESLGEFRESSFGTAKCAGARLYYLMNLSLQSEDILADSSIQTAANKLIDLIYEGCIDFNFVVGFAEECESHNSIKSKNGPKSDNDELSKLIDPPKEYGETMSASRISSLSSFVNDLCDAFIEYGAQFEFCRKSMYFFFSSHFPSKIKCDLIQRCRGTLHLISVDREEDLKVYLRRCLLGGIPCIDYSNRDTPSVLDAAVAVLTQEGTVCNHSAFVISWAVALLLRDLAGCLLVGENLLSCKQRMLALPENYSQAILTSAESLAKTQGKLDDIIDASTAMQLGNASSEYSVETQWDRIMLELRSSY